MKKIVIIALILVMIFGSFIAGKASGVKHAIEDSCIWTVDRYDPDNPEESAWNGYDQLIFIELDGNIFEHGMYQG